MLSNSRTKRCFLTTLLVVTTAAGPALAAKPKFLDKLFGFGKKSKPTAPTNPSPQRPSAQQRPQSVYRSNDQYIAELLRNAESKPAQGFAARNPLLQRGVNPQPQQPRQRTKDEKIAEVADWMSVTHDSPQSPASFTATRPAPNRQVSANESLKAAGSRSQEESIYGTPSAPIGSGTIKQGATNNTPNGSKASTSQPSVYAGDATPQTPKEYQGVQVPGMPEQAKLLWIKDRVVGNPNTEVKVKDMRLVTETLQGQSNIAISPRNSSMTMPSAVVANSSPTTNTNVAAAAAKKQPQQQKTVRAVAESATSAPSAKQPGQSSPTNTTRQAVAVHQESTSGDKKPATKLAQSTSPIYPPQGYDQSVIPQPIPAQGMPTQGYVQPSVTVPGGAVYPSNVVSPQDFQNAVNMQQGMVTTNPPNLPTLPNYGSPKTTVTQGGVIIREYPPVGQSTVAPSQPMTGMAPGMSMNGSPMMHDPNMMAGTTPVYNDGGIVQGGVVNGPIVGSPMVNGVSGSGPQGNETVVSDLPLNEHIAVNQAMITQGNNPRAGVAHNYPTSSSPRGNLSAAPIEKPIAAKKPKSKNPRPQSASESEYMSNSATAEASDIARGHVQQGMYLLQTDPEAAEEELLRALTIIAQSRDKKAGTKTYTKTLANGIAAMWEADELHEAYTNQGEDYALQVASEFTTMVGKSISKKMVSLDDALDTYHDYARQSLVIAAGEEKVGSQALYGMARLFQIAARENPVAEEIENKKAKSFFLVASAVDPDNWKSTNELGVLFAKEGRLIQAENAFKRSIKVKQTPEVWHNLAAVYRRQNRTDLAMIAENKSSMLGGMDPSLPSSQIQVAEMGDDPAMKRLFSLTRKPARVATRTAPANTPIASRPRMTTPVTPTRSNQPSFAPQQSPSSNIDVLRAAPPSGSSNEGDSQPQSDPQPTLAGNSKKLPSGTQPTFSQKFSSMFRAKFGNNYTANSKAHTRLR